MFRFVGKFLGLLLLLIGCSDIPRDNPLDPANKNSFTQPVILVEGFINTAPENPYVNYSTWAIEGMEKITQIYKEQILIAEYHRDVNGYDDPYNSEVTSQKFTQIQDSYIAEDDPVPRGVPDVFINGQEKRISGASSSTSVLTEATPVLDKLTAQQNYYLIQPRVETTGGDLQIGCLIAALGNRTGADLKMRLLFVKDMEQPFLHHVVQDVSPLKSIGDLKKGSYKEVDFDPVANTGKFDYIIYVLYDSQGKNVLQTVKENL